MPRYTVRTSYIVVAIAAIAAIITALAVPSHLWLIAGFLAYCIVASVLSFLLADQLEAEDQEY